MNIEQFKAIVRQLKGVKVLWVHGWGEPLLYGDLIEAIDYSMKFIPSVTMVTNATLLNEAMSHKLSQSKLSRLCVSIDATDKQTFEDIRGCDFESVIHNVKYFRRCSNIPITISSVISRQNMKSLIDMPQLAKDLGASNIHFFHLYESDASRKYNFTRVASEGELSEFTNKVRKNARRASILTNVSSLMQDNQVMCWLPYMNPYINFRGFLTSCCNWPDHNLCSVLENGFANAWNSSPMRSLREALLAEDYPQRCKDWCQIGIKS